MVGTVPPQQSALNIVMGAMTFGAPGTDGARVHDVKDIEAILDVFLKHGHREVRLFTLCCAPALTHLILRAYTAGGTCEEYLGKINWQEKGILMETKLYPTPGKEFTGSHSPEDLRKFLMMSLKALNTEWAQLILLPALQLTDSVLLNSKIEMWYLHGPDRSVPYEVTLKAVDELYREGHFRRFGISNYMAWEVAEMVGICKRNGYIQPTAYQGIYNAIHRGVEPELFPRATQVRHRVLRVQPPYNFFFAGGFFTDRYTSMDEKPESGSRFDPERNQGKNYRKRYWKPAYFEALAAIRPVVEAHGLTMAEVALRWISHHSLMRREHGDAVLIGASSLAHIEQNLIDLEKGPLPDEVLKALDSAWEHVKPHASNYYH
ncbi:Aldo/keto reductase [Mycena venus]|uniref:Aldo/keto reductase n=1 Tax=Mycena venus TaxID=2733690 RepID=A0A8H6XS74_9AGAR|nr:Aldo/keto reductase [Mycena venus]